MYVYQNNDNIIFGKMYVICMYGVITGNNVCMYVCISNNVNVMYIWQWQCMYVCNVCM
jgi:hypothetical protein